jgi:hypothetical protein
MLKLWASGTSRSSGRSTSAAASFTVWLTFGITALEFCHTGVPTVQLNLSPIQSLTTVLGAVLSSQ